MNETQAPPAAFLALFASMTLFTLGAILALDAGLFWLAYRTLARLFGKPYYPERAAAYEAAQFAVYGGLAAPALFAGLRFARRWSDDRRLLWACFLLGASAAAGLSLTLGYAHLSAGPWSAAPPTAAVLAAGLLALRQTPSLSQSGRESPR